MAKRHFRIVAPEQGHGTTLEMDGVPITDARSVSFRTGVGELTKVTVEYVGCTVDIDADVHEDDPE